ncbi:MAG: hypothetical protein ACJAUA_001086 [Zhongshania aliphaticivorans]|jgi:hypothetical protein
MFDITSLTFKYCLVGMAILTILLSWIGARRETPVLMLVTRWLRWLLFSGLFAYLLKVFELSLRPDWVHFAIGFMLWFLFETGYNWVAINALSQSDIPLFPKFKVNKDGDEWPTVDSLSKIKSWLERENFKRLSVLKAELFEGIFLRASIYESPDRITRVQILFVPKRKDGVVALYTLSTNGQNDSRLITDNHSLPFGGYYPESWNFVRKPLIGSLEKLFHLHGKRLTGANFEPAPFEDDPLEELNQQQHLLEHLNTKCGFLNPLQHREESGRLTYDGRYRLWKEMWLLAYFGKSVS